MKKLLTIIAFLFTCISLSAKIWIDVTDNYIQNPRYDYNQYTGWEGTPLSGYNPKENAEHYQKDYDTYQKLTGLTPGQYRLSLKAFYRMGNSGNDYALYSSGNYSDYQYAELYVQTSAQRFVTKITPASSGCVRESLGGAASTVSSSGGNWWDTNVFYIPNNMEAAYYWFEAGHYTNVVEFTVGNDGEATIGIFKNTTLGEDWTCLDDWKLEYYGDNILVESISIPSAVDVVMGEEYQIEPSILPDDAVNKKLSWSTNSSSVATVDNNGIVKAIKKGKAVITCTSTDGTNISAKCTVNVTDNVASAENIIINEIMAANIDVYFDPSMNYGSWVELYNPTDKSVNLGELYVTDDTKNLTKHKLISSYGTLPAKGYALLNFDHHEPFSSKSYRQIDDKLDCEGGLICITDGESIIAQQTYPAAITRTSWGRTTDGGDTWSFSGTPTPGTSNNNDGGFAKEQLPAPEINLNSQFFTTSLSLQVTIPEGATLRYTTNGTTPTLSNGLTSTTGKFTVRGSSAYRFRLFADGYLPSKVVTRSFIKDTGNYKFPSISLVTDRDGIFDTDRAIFAYSSNGRPGNGQQQSFNANMDWDRPVNFEFFNEEGEVVVSQECDFSACGGWSRAWSPHSFKLKASKLYDLQNSFDYQFFSEKPNLKHKTLQIRNGGNDSGCRIKDASIQGVVASSGLYVDHQAWQPVHVFINGSHYAVLNMREPNNKHYAYANYGIDTDLMDQFEICPDSNYVQMAGTKDSFDRLITLSEKASDSAIYEEIKELLDIDEYCNYMAVQLYIGNTDWPQNNVKGFRDQDNGKFHFVIFDTDHGFGTDSPFITFANKRNYTFDTRYGYDYSKGTSIQGQRMTAEIQFVSLFLNLLNNSEFRKKFIDSFCLVAGSVFEPQRSREVISEMSAYLNQGNFVNSTSTANDVINRLSNRQATLINSLRNYSKMQLSGVNAQKVSLESNIGEAKILLNDIEVPTGKFSGSLFAPVKLKAVAPSGYKFMGWTNNSGAKTTKTILSKASSWYYYDGGSLDGKSWNSSSYSTTGWKQGTTPIGYGKTVNTTTTTNLPTYYMRKNISLSGLQPYDTFVLDWTADDGFIVYVNGVEAGRYNMPSGSVNYNTFATSYAANNPDSGTMTLNTSLFKNGTNTIAVEVHNNSTTSTDILWECSIVRETTNLDETEYITNDLEYTLPTSGTHNLKAVWKAMTKEEMMANKKISNPIVINELSAGNSIFVNDYFKKDDWVELYNTTDNDIDITGYYLSDNANKPTKYQIPFTEGRPNIIPAHGYFIIWASKREDIGGDIHASFKLGNNDGEIVLLTDASETYTDTLRYNEHGGQQSVGRYPDGASDIYVFNNPTPKNSNQYNSSSLFLYEQIFEDGQDADGIRELFTDHLSKSSVYTIGGFKLNNASIGNLRTGVYIIKSETSTGKVISRKIVVK